MDRANGANGVNVTKSLPDWTFVKYRDEIMIWPATDVFVRQRMGIKDFEVMEEYAALYEAAGAHVPRMRWNYMYDSKVFRSANGQWNYVHRGQKRLDGFIRRFGYENRTLEPWA